VAEFAGLRTLVTGGSVTRSKLVMAMVVRYIRAHVRLAHLDDATM
jgi:hypothetical protein